MPRPKVAAKQMVPSCSRSCPCVTAASVGVFYELFFSI